MLINSCEIQNIKENLRDIMTDLDHLEDSSSHEEANEQISRINEVMSPLFYNNWNDFLPDIKNEDLKKCLFIIKSIIWKE